MIGRIFNSQRDTERQMILPKIVAAKWIAALTLAMTAASAAARADTPPPQGLWLWDDGRAGVEFHTCGAALCGRLVWLKQEADASASPALDVRNPDPALRSRPLCGLDYITGVKRTTGGDWKGGRVYDFTAGATYDLDINAIGPVRMRMRGYKGVRLLGQDLLLVRPSTPLVRCRLAGGS